MDSMFRACDAQALPRLPAFPQRLQTLITKRLKRRNDGCVDSSSKVEHVCFSNFLQTYFHQSDPGTLLRPPRPVKKPVHVRDLAPRTPGV